MGREARCAAEWPDGAGEVALRLEATTLELRGGVRRNLPRSTITDVRAENGRLTLTAPDGPYAFDLGDPAARWAAAITAPPPTLATKLGLKEGIRAYAPAPLADPVLAEAAAAHLTTDPAQANLWLATVESEAELATTFAAHEKATTTAPLWIANRKGKASPYGDTAVRAFMRGHSYIDTKSCAASDTWSATRYSKRQP